MKKYILIILLFLLSFLSIWSNDNINYDKYKNLLENFENNNCPKRYMENLLKIRKEKHVNKGYTSNTYTTNLLDIETNRSGSELYTGNYPKEYNYNFSIKEKK